MAQRYHEKYSNRQDLNILYCYCKMHDRQKFMKNVHRLSSNLQNIVIRATIIKNLHSCQIENKLNFTPQLFESMSYMKLIHTMYVCIKF